MSESVELEPGQALTVWLRDGGGAEHRVGRLAWRDRTAWFEHDDAFLATGRALSPFHLPLRPGVLRAPVRPFEGLFGLFADSLPDGWGRLLQDRAATAAGVNPATLTPLDRLARVGRTSIGALAYEPELTEPLPPGSVDLDALAAGSARILAQLEGPADEVLPELLRLGGSPQGARPKVLVWLRPGDHHVASGPDAPSPDHVPVLVKFRATVDGPEAGAIEHAYHQLARRAGLDVPDSWLLPSDAGAGWFAVRRFDRTPGGRVHTHTLSGLLHADHRLPSLDYVGAHAAVHRLTGDHGAVEQFFRRMVFHVVGHNRDDHARQHALQQHDDGRWALAPAYDLTFSEGPGGEHSMALAGRGDPDLEAVLAVAEQVGVSAAEANAVVEEVSTAVVDGWTDLAPSDGARRRIAARLVPLV